VSATLHVQPAKIVAIRRQARIVMRDNTAGTLTIRRLASLTGKIVALMPAFRQAHFRRHALQRCVTFGLLRSNQTWDARVRLSRTALRDVRWWSLLSPQKACSGGLPWRQARPRRAITVDASGMGWGAWYATRSFSRPARTTTRAEWPPAMRARAVSSNLRETMAATLSAMAFRHLVPDDSELLIRSDNTTAVAAIRRWGSRSPSIGKAIEPLLRWALRHNVSLTAEHIPGIENGLADRLSRWSATRNEWGLTHSTLTSLTTRCPRLAQLSIDLFASDAHHLLPRFVTIDWCPEAQWIDAFSQPWTDECPLLVPPINMIEAVLGRLLDDVPRLSLLVTPFWQSASWWATAMSLASNLYRLAPTAVRPPPGMASVLRRGPPPQWAAFVLSPSPQLRARQQ
jgi:hypothetical protein